MNRFFDSIFKTVLLLALALSGSMALAGSWNNVDLTRMNNAEPPIKNTRDHGFKMGSGKCVFDPSAVSGDRTTTAHACNLLIPKNSYVTKAYYKVVTTFTSATDAATIAIKITGANDIVSAIAISDGTNVWDSGGLVPTIPTGALSNEVAVTADSYPTFTVAVEALTAGKLVLWLEWAYYGDT